MNFGWKIKISSERIKRRISIGFRIFRSKQKSNCLLKSKSNWWMEKYSHSSQRGRQAWRREWKLWARRQWSERLGLCKIARQCSRSIASIMRAVGAHFESHLHTRSIHCRVQSWSVAPCWARIHGMHARREISPDPWMWIAKLLRAPVGNATFWIYHII